MGWLADNSTFHSSIPEAADLAVAVVYSVFGVCSLVGNNILLYVSYKKRKLLKPAEFFIINLAVSDLGMTLSLYPLAVTSSIYHRWLYGETLCLVYAFCGVLFGICSLTTLTLLSIVCCLKVCYPHYGNHFGPDHGCVLIAFAWVYALLFALSPLAQWGAYGPEPYGTACCIDWSRSNREGVACSYTVALFLCCYLLPCAVITFSYGQILRTVRESRRAVQNHLAAQAHMGNIQTVIVKLSVAVCIGFFAAWSPYALVSMWAAFGYIDSIPPMAFAVPAMFAKSSTLYNPLVYLLLKPNFRHVLCKDLLSLQGACLQRCRCVQRLSYRSILAVHLRALRPRIDSAPSTCTVVGHAHCFCECCKDPFECFRQYPRRCHVHINTVQLSHQDLVSPGTTGSSAGPRHVPGPSPGLRAPAKLLPASRKTVRIVVRGKKSAELDNLEVTLETLPSHSKAAEP